MDRFMIIDVMDVMIGAKFGVVHVATGSGSDAGLCIKHKNT